jgi:hypothetical protein
MSWWLVMCRRRSSLLSGGYSLHPEHGPGALNHSLGRRNMLAMIARIHPHIVDDADTTTPQTTTKNTGKQAWRIPGVALLKAGIKTSLENLRFARCVSSQIRALECVKDLVTPSSHRAVVNVFLVEGSVHIESHSQVKSML